MKKTLLLSFFALFLLTACGGPVDSSAQQLGKDSAKVLVEEFSDLQCPACAAISPQVEQFVKDNPDLARLQYYHFPLSQHEHAFIAAEASECAADQGKFWEYIGTVFETQANLNEDHLYKIADNLELDRTAFDDCLDSGAKRGKIRAHMAEGAGRRVAGTPSIFVNGQLVRWSDAETFKSYLESL